MKFPRDCVHEKLRLDFHFSSRDMRNVSPSQHVRPVVELRRILNMKPRSRTRSTHRSSEQETIRIESAKVELYAEIPMPKVVVGRNLDHRKAELSIAKLECVRLIRMTSDLRDIFVCVRCGRRACVRGEEIFCHWLVKFHLIERDKTDISIFSHF